MKKELKRNIENGKAVYGLYEPYIESVIETDGYEAMRRIVVVERKMLAALFRIIKHDVQGFRRVAWFMLAILEALIMYPVITACILINIGNANWYLTRFFDRPKRIWLTIKHTIIDTIYMWKESYYF